MAREITASPEQLLGDGRYAAKEALISAKSEIDALFGEGFAAKNPEVLAAMISASTIAGSAAISHSIQQEGFQKISSSISEIASNLIFMESN